MAAGVRSDGVTIRAHNVALLSLLPNCGETPVSGCIGHSKALAAPHMVELHHVRGILDPTIGTRPILEGANKLPSGFTRIAGHQFLFFLLILAMRSSVSGETWAKGAR